MWNEEPQPEQQGQHWQTTEPYQAAPAHGQYAPQPVPPPYGGQFIVQPVQSPQKRKKLNRGCIVSGGIGLLIMLCLCTMSVTIAANVKSQTQTAAGVTTPVRQQKAAPHHSKTTSTFGHTPVPTSVRPTATPRPAPTPQPSPTPTPTPIPTQPPAPTPTPPPATGVNGNPWGYDFNAGNLIYQPAGDFCSYFSCVSTFWIKTNGYVAECGNGEYTHSGGVQGACSRDGGVWRALYSH